MKLEVNEVYSFKMNSGEEFIAKFVSEDANNIVINEPMSVAPGQNGQPTLVPTMFTVEVGKDLTLNKYSVAMTGLTADAVRVGYVKATTGIDTPSKKIILG
jgi:hypothetical protein